MNSVNVIKKMEKIQSDMEMFMNSSNIKFNMTSAQVTCIMCDTAHICHH